MLSTHEKVVEYGYMINLFGIFLMVANGINQVYSPKVRQLYSDNKDEAFSFSKKILVVYFFIAVLAYLAYQSILYINNDLNILDAKSLDIFTVMPYAIFVFWIGSFKYISDVYIYITDAYKKFATSLFVVEIFSLSLAIYLLKEYNVSLLNAYLVIVIARSSFTFMYTKTLLRS